MQAWHKKEKQKQIKKGKVEKSKIRTEKLARRNPDRIQKQIDEFKALEESGRISTHDRKQLQELEKDLAAVKKAKETLAPQLEEGRAKKKAAGGDQRKGGAQQGGVKRAADSELSSNVSKRERAGNEFY